MRVLIYTETWPLAYAFEHYSKFNSLYSSVHKYEDLTSFIIDVGKYPDTIILLDASPHKHVMLLCLLRSISLKSRIVTVSRKVLLSDEAVCSYIKNSKCIPYSHIPDMLFKTMQESSGVMVKSSFEYKRPLLVMLSHNNRVWLQRVNKILREKLLHILKKPKVLQIISLIDSGMPIIDIAERTGLSAKIIYSHRHYAAMRLKCQKNYWSLSLNISIKSSIKSSYQKDDELINLIKERCQYNSHSSSYCEHCNLLMACYSRRN